MRQAWNRRGSWWLSATLLLAILNFTPTLSQAAVPTPQFWLTASPSKISGTSWTNDGSVGGSATLSSFAATPPTFQSSDSSVALNATAGTGQYITGVAGSMTGVTAITFEIVMKIPAKQVYLDTFRTYTFVMSVGDKSDTGEQRIYIDGVKQNPPYSFLSGTASVSDRKIFHTGGNFNIGRYGSLNDFPGSFNIRSFKLWLSNIGDAAVTESYSTQLKPTSHILALSSGLTTAVYRTASTIRSTSDVDGKVTFFFNGKRIPSCVNIQTQNKVASCTWKPAAVGTNRITAQIVANGGSLGTSTFNINVAPRSGKR